MSYRLFLVVFLALLINACGTTKKSVIHRQDSNLSLPKVIYFDVSNLNETNVDLTILGYDGDQLAQSMYQANLNNAMNNANYNAAGGLAGALIAGALVRNIAEQRAIEQKNAPIEHFLSMVNSQDWSQIIATVPFPEQLTLTLPEQQEAMSITPLFSVSVDYRSLFLQALVEIVDTKGKLVHRNYYHIESLPLLAANETITNLNSYDQEEFSGLASSMFLRLPRLVELDLASDSNYVNNAIRFKNYRGGFYSRGEILKQCDGTVVFRNLRKEVKEIPCA